MLYICLSVHGVKQLSAKASDSQFREPETNSFAAVSNHVQGLSFDTAPIHLTVWVPGYRQWWKYVYSLHLLIAAWLNASHRSQDGDWLNSSARNITEDWILNHNVSFIFTFHIYIHNNRSTGMFSRDTLNLHNAISGRQLKHCTVLQDQRSLTTFESSTVG